MNHVALDTATRKPAAEGSSRTLTTELYERLRRDIIGGRLAPGIKLRIEALSEQYKVGGSPVREALSRLSAEGLVEKREQRGFSVAEVSLKDIRTLVKTRCWLEEIALRESMKNRTDAWEEQVLLAFHRMSRVPRLARTDPPAPSPAADELHWAFHDALLANCDSPWLLGYCKELREQCERYRALAAPRIYKPGRDILGEHDGVLKAVLDHDADTAVQRLTAHYRATLQQIESHFGG